MRRIAGFSALILGTLVVLDMAAHAADGEGLYDANCAQCHGADGRADTPIGKAVKAASLVDPKWTSEEASDLLVSSFRKNPKHKAIDGKVSDDDLKAIAVHVRELAAAGE